MKIQVASDLHLELLPQDYGIQRLLVPHPQADILVLAGDIHNGTKAIKLFRNWPVPVLYVAGNHEFYGQVWEDTRRDLQEACAGTAVQFLDNAAVEIGNVRFLGTTLWTDFAIDRSRPPASAMELAGASLRDFFQILSRQDDSRPVPITPGQLLADHQVARDWLQERLNAPFEGKTVVITHHAPHRLSVHRRFVGDPLTPAFASDLTELLGHADLWLHGHAHDGFDYRVGKCRVVSNPAGYSLTSKAGIEANDEFRLENGSYEPSCLLTL